MEMYTIIMDYKCQHCKNINSLYINLQIEYNPIQNLITFLTEFVEFDMFLKLI